jgi:hypothetical protein
MYADSFHPPKVSKTNTRANPKRPVEGVLEKRGA